MPRRPTSEASLVFVPNHLRPSASSVDESFPWEDPGQVHFKKGNFLISCQNPTETCTCPGFLRDLVRGVLDSWLGKPQRKLKEGRVNLVYRFQSEDTAPLQMRLKVEINSREHFTELWHTRVPVRVDNRWFTGVAEVTSYELDELLATDRGAGSSGLAGLVRRGRGKRASQNK